ncbi:MAG: hypothetical protein U0K37_02220 [Acutalibacteraceae bacterium]|nr:hypothetical protein [Acutalibacteraceae bacterium]
MSEKNNEKKDDKTYHQISLAENTPELFGDAAEEEAAAAQKSFLVDEGAGESPKKDEDNSWKEIHNEFAAEVERFAQEAEDFAQKVTDYVNNPDVSSGMQKKKEAPVSPDTVEIWQPEQKKKWGRKAKQPAEPVAEEPETEPEVIPEPEPEPELESEPLPLAPKASWHRRLQTPVLGGDVVAAAFDIPLGDPDEENAESAAYLSDREKPKYSFNDEPTSDLSPLDELHLDADNLDEYLNMEHPELDALKKGAENLEEADAVDGDTAILPDFHDMEELQEKKEEPMPIEPLAEEPEANAPREEAPEVVPAPTAKKEKKSFSERMKSSWKNFADFMLGRGDDDEWDGEEPAAVATENPEEEPPEELQEPAVEPATEEPVVEEPVTDETAEPEAAEPEITEPETEEPAEAEENNEPAAVAQETVGLPPIRNENIDHQFHQDKVVNPNPYEIEETYNSFKTTVLKNVDTSEEPTMDLAEAQKVREDTKFDHTFELNKATPIVAADAKLSHLDRTIIAAGDVKPIAHHESEEIDGQIRLDGFDSEGQVPEQVDDDEVAEDLRRKRSERVRDFKLERPEEVEEKSEESEETESESPKPIYREDDISDYFTEEYERPEDRRGLIKDLDHVSKRQNAFTVIQGLLALAGLILGIFVALAQGNLDAIGGSAASGGVISLFMLAASAGLGYKTMRKGFLGIIHKKINSASGIVVLYVVVAIETIVMMAAGGSADAASLYTGAACLAMFLDSLSHSQSLKRAIGDFKFLVSGTSLHSTKVVEEPDDAMTIGKGMLGEDPIISYQSETEVPEGVMEDTFADDPTDENSRLPFFITVIGSVLIAAVYAIVVRSAVSGMNVLASVFAMAVPAFALLAGNFGLNYEDKRFSKKNAVILGHRAVNKSASVDSFALNSTDLFGKGACNIAGIKTFGDMKIDDAILYAGALVIQSGGPLADVFHKTILGKKELLPPIEDLIYEERLGLSAWNHNRRILFGNREFMVNHNIELPDEKIESDHVAQGRKICYLAISGKAAAMFVLQYRASRRIRKCLKHMDRAGITVLVRNTDCNVTEDMLSKKFRIPAAAVKVISPMSGDLLKKYQDGEEGTVAENIGLLHNGNPTAAMDSLYEARRLYDGISVNKTLSMASSITALVVGIIIAAATATGFLSDPFVMLFQVVWTLIAVGIAWYRAKQNFKRR